jgi:Tol biopolymer transport system component
VRVLAVLVAIVGAACSADGSRDARSAASVATSIVPASPFRVLYLSRSESSPVWQLEERLPSETSSTRVPTPQGADVEQPDVTDRGDRVVYLAGDGTEARELWITDISHLDDTVPVKVPSSEQWDCVRWMPDGQHLLVVRDQPELEVAILSAKTGEKQIFTLGATTRTVGCGDPSPDGSSFALAVSSEQDAQLHNLRDIVKVDIASGAVTPIGSLPEGCIANNPSWAPVGDLLATDAICRSPEDNGIWLFTPTAESPRKLIGENPPGTTSSNDNLQYWAPQWTPTGDAILYYRAAPSFSANEVRIIGLDGHDDRRLIEPRSSFPVAAAVGE